MLLSLTAFPSTGAQVAGDSASGVRVCAGGDVTLGTNLDTTWTYAASAKYGVDLRPLPDPDSLLAPLKEFFSGSDIVLLNIEGAIGEGRADSKCAADSSNCFAFRQPPAVADAIARVASPAAIIGNVANNHSRDAGDSGFRQTVRRLKRAGVAVTGADTLATPVATIDGDTVAFLGFHTSRDTPDARDIRAVRRHVARAARRWKRVVVTAHLGAEGIGAQRTYSATEMFLKMDRGNPVAFAHAAIDAGADLVVMHGPHVLRAAEWHRDGLALYSLGNLLTYGPFRLTDPMNRSAVACVTLDDEGHPFDAVLKSTWQRYPGSLAADPSGRGTILIDSLSRLDFPRTGVTIDTAGIVGRISPRRDSVLHRP